MITELRRHYSIPLGTCLTFYFYGVPWFDLRWAVDEQDSVSPFPNNFGVDSSTSDEWKACLAWEGWGGGGG